MTREQFLTSLRLLFSPRRRVSHSPRPSFRCLETFRQFFSLNSKVEAVFVQKKLPLAMKGVSDVQEALRIIALNSGSGRNHSFRYTRNAEHSWQASVVC